MKLYKRDGRRFVEIENHEGLYRQQDGTYQEKRDKNSIGLCIISRDGIDAVMALKEEVVTLEEAKNMEQYLPTYEEMLKAITSYSKQLSIRHLWQRRYWIKKINGYVRSDFGYVAKRSRRSDYSYGGVGCLVIDNFPTGRDSYYGYGSRLLRKVLRIQQ